jgi:alditol oxidase
VAREHAVAAIEALRGLGDAIRPALQVCEIRTVAGDHLWMSPQYGQDTVGVHFTWKREPELVGRLVAAVELALGPYAPRPHWGKLFLAGAATIADRYERLPDFRALAERLDPRGAFRNDWMERHVFR